MKTEVVEDILRRLNKAFESIGIDYWITDGTLLGWARDKGAIPHDKDSDIGVRIEDLAPVYPAFLRAMVDNGFRRHHTWGCLDVGLETAWKVRGVKLDVFTYYPDFERPGTVWSPAWAKHMIKYRYPVSALLPLQDIVYGSVPTKAPADVITWVETKYGEGWRKPVKKWDWAYSPSNAQRSSVVSITTGSTLSTLSAAEVYQQVQVSQARGMYKKHGHNGHGSTQHVTKDLREALPELCRSLNISTLIDAPCGNYSWMSSVDLGSVAYIGVDILTDVLAENAKKFTDVTFIEADLVNTPLGIQGDMVMCRDFFQHLTLDAAVKALENLRGTGARYLLCNTFLSVGVNRDLTDAQKMQGWGWRPIAPELPPFNLQPTKYSVAETQIATDRVMRVYEL